MRAKGTSHSGVSERDGSDIRFPWIGVGAPLVASIVLWLTTGSPLSLIFGLLSPLTLVAHFADARRTSRRRAAQQRSERERAKRDEDNEHRRKREAEVAQLNALYPAAEKLAQLVPTARRRSRGNGEQMNIRLGVRTDGHPFVFLASDGLIVEGTSNRARAIRRAVTAQAWWMAGELHASSEEVVTSRRGDARWLVVEEGSHVGGRATHVAVIDRDAPGMTPVRVVPDELSIDGLSHFRDVLASSRQDATTALARNATPTSGVAWPAPLGLPVLVGETREGKEVELDIVTHGPHVAISGTTGSGKTTFIINWLGALAARFSPAQLEIAVVDFKGGIDFVRLSELPHCVGMATDVEDESIERALVALRVEMVRRERVLRDAPEGGVNALPRLIVVLDEFRATAAAHPAAVSVVEDLVARGRALGVHVVLSTQRASTGISDDIIANVPVRIAFRALSATESRFMVGCDLAFSQVRDVGDAIISGPSAESIFFRALGVGQLTATRVKAPPSDKEESGESRRRLWMPALPRRLSLADVGRLASSRADRHVHEYAMASDNKQNELVLGLADSPKTQDWRSVAIDLFKQGHLLITGSTRSGRTTAASLLANQLRSATTQSTGRVNLCWPADVVALWDHLDVRHAGSDRRDGCGPETGTDATVLIIDGIESLLASLPIEFREVLLERLSLMLRVPGSRRCIITCDSTGAWEARFASLFAQRLDFVGGANRPGNARWDDLDMQVALPDSTTSEGSSFDAPTRTVATSSPTCVVVTRLRGDSLIDMMSALAAAGLSVVESATPEEWMNKLHVFSELSVTHAIVVTAEIGLSDARVLLRTHAPVPPVAPGSALVLLPNGNYERVPV